MDVRNSAGALPPRPLIGGPTPLMRNMVRPGPYDRINDRFGAGMGGGVYGRGRGRNAVRGDCRLITMPSLRLYSSLAMKFMIY